MNKVQYYHRLINLFLNYKRGKTKLSYLPVRLWIEPTNYCNLRCIMCPNKELKKQEKGYMDFELFKRIIDEASKFVFDVHLLHRGESLLHPDFFKMVKYAHEAKIVTKFHTNGTLLDEEKSHKLIESGLDQISFSFDGYDKETYESIRVGGDYKKTIGNIVQFLQIKKKLNSKKPFAILELISFSNSPKKMEYSKKEEFINNFKGLPLDKMEIKEMHNWAGEVVENQSQGIGTKIKKQKSKNYSPCTFLWQALIIFWNGCVLPCTQDFHGYYTLGNVKDSSITEIWNNERMVNLRKKMIDRDIENLKTCSNCDRLWRKKILGIPKEYLWKFLLKKMP